MRPPGGRRTAGRGRLRRDGPDLHGFAAAAHDGRRELARRRTRPSATWAGWPAAIEARFWWSRDGRSWRPGTLDGDPAGTRVAAVEALPGGGFVAVGATGDARAAVGSAVWTSPDGRAWTRVADSAALRQGVDARADRGRRSRAGGCRQLVGQHPAVAWRSADGVDWTMAPDAPSLGNFGLGIEMHDVAWDGTRLVAVGHRLFGTQYPTGVVWVSTDGIAWDRATESAALSQGKIEGVAAVPGGFAAVGTFGAPDAAIPTVWLSPP